MQNIEILQARYMRGQFSEESSIIVVIGGETLYVPLDPANRYYAEILRQVEAGTLTIADAE
jgi:hypothetical protein